MTDEPQTSNGNGGFTDAASYPGFSRPERHQLPSGAVFLLRRPNIMRMVRRGEIPNPLMEVVSGIFKERDVRELAAEAAEKGLTVEEILEERERDAEKEPPPVPEAEDDEVNLKVAFGFGDVIVWAAIVEPKVEFEPQVSPDTPLTANGLLAFDALSDDDVQYILSWANGGAANLATFPAEPERPDHGRDSGTVRDAAEPVAGHPA